MRSAKPGPRVCGLSIWLTCCWAGLASQAAAQAGERDLTIQTVEVSPRRKESPETVEYLGLADAPAFLPRSYLYWGSPTGPEERRQPLVFGLEYALHLPAYNDLRRKALLGKSWAGAATLSFEGALRMLAEESKPVRMASYRPTLSGQLFYLWYRPQPVLFALQSGFFHYSNGQERCIFDPREGDDTAACRESIANVSSPSRQLNRRTGNFSTNGYLLALHGRIHRLNARGLGIGQLAFGLSLAGNLHAGPGSMEPELRELYGWGELRCELEAYRLFSWGSLTLRGEASGYPSSGPKVPKAAGELEAVIGPYWFTGFGVFVRYGGGRDFYNAFFVDSIQQFAVGLAWNGDRPLTFRPAQADAS